MWDEVGEMGMQLGKWGSNWGNGDAVGKPGINECWMLDGEGE